MTHFRLPHSQLIPGGTRLFADGDRGFERLILETGKSIAMELADVPALAKPIVKATGAVPDTVKISALAGSGTRRRFTITGNRPGMAGLLAEDGRGNHLGTNPLFFVFVGHFENHPTMETDLIANVFRSSDGAKMHILARMLFNNWENLFNESSEANQLHWCENYAKHKKTCLPCGTVSKAGGSKIWKPIGYHYKNTYYDPIPQAKRNSTLVRADIRYTDKRIDAACQAIKKRLEAGEPSVVGLVYIPESAIRQDGTFLVTGKGGHSVPIVGCNSAATRFLYIDVYPNGSKLVYGGGHAGKNLFPNECTHLGLFEIDSSRGTKVLRQHVDSENFFSGPSFLEVVSGPIDATSKGT